MNRNLSHILGLQSTLVFEARTLTSELSDEPTDEPVDEPTGKLAAVCVLAEPETEEESLAPYAEIPPQRVASGDACRYSCHAPGLSRSFAAKPADGLCRMLPPHQEGHEILDGHGSS